MDFFVGLFHFAVFLTIVAIIVAWVSYNKLQRAAQNVKEKSSNIQIALSKKISEINQLLTMVKGYQEFEQFTQLRVATVSDVAGMAAVYQQSNTTLAAIQTAAQRFPELLTSTQYHRLIDSIQYCEANIQENRMVYNQAVNAYNSICLAIPRWEPGLLIIESISWIRCLQWSMATPVKSKSCCAAWATVTG